MAVVTTRRAMLRAAAVLISVASFAAMVLWYGFLEPPFLSYPHGSRFDLVSDVVVAGQSPILKVYRCNSSNEEEGYFIASRLVRLDPPPGPPPKPVILAGGLVPLDSGCGEEASAASRTPATQEPGLYFVSGISIVPGRWKTTKISWSSAPFRLVPPNEPDPAPNRTP